MMTKNIASHFAGATNSVLDSMLWLVPNIIIAILVVMIGWMISVIIGKLFESILNKLHINKAAEELGITKLLSDASIKTDMSEFIGEVIKWFFAIVFFIVAVDFLQLAQVTGFLNKILLYIPNIIAAVLILAVGVIIANFLNKIIHKSAKISGFISPDVLGETAKWSILILAILAALTQLGIAQKLIETIVTGMVLMISLAGGLAFGLGGKDKAKEILDKMSSNKK